MEKSEMRNGMGVLEATFGEQPQAKLEAMFIVVGDWTKGEWDFAVKAWLQRGKKFPLPSDICECRPGVVSKDEKAVQAWDHIWDEKDRLTAYNPHVQAHPHGRNCEPIALKAIGGVEGLNRLWAKQGDSRDVEFLKKEFLKEFKRLMEDDSRGALQLDASSTKAFADRGGVKSLGAAIDGLTDPRR